MTLTFCTCGDTFNEAVEHRCENARQDSEDRQRRLILRDHAGAKLLIAQDEVGEVYVHLEEGPTWTGIVVDYADLLEGLLHVGEAWDR